MNGKIIASILAGLVLLLILFILPSINMLPPLDEEVNAKWSQVENQYKRRADLVPNLVSIVKGYASHESQTLTAVIEARSKAFSGNANSSGVPSNDAQMAEFMKNQNQLSGTLSRLMLLTENYPDLKADKGFIELQSQLEGTENRISVARRDYIEAVKEYNIALRTFPGIIWAKTIHSDLKIKPNFANEDKKSNETPQITF